MTEYSHCPDCSAPLGKDRGKCRCGWTTPAALARELNPSHIPCADDPNCRKPGRLWLEGMPTKHRICVDHYYARLDRR